MLRDHTTLTNPQDGWYPFESLSTNTKRLTDFLDNYELRVHNEDSNLWVSVLLHQDNSIDIMPEYKNNGSMMGYFFKKFSGIGIVRDILYKSLANGIIEEGIADYRNKETFRKGIEEGTIDGYYCAMVGSYVQECIEILLDNAERGKRYTEFKAIKGPGGCTVLRGASAHEIDTLGTYLLEGQLTGKKEDWKIVLNATHPHLPDFTGRGEFFNDAYFRLVEKMKMSKLNSNFRTH